MTQFVSYYCLKLIINAGISTVVAHRQYRLVDGVKLLRAAHVTVLFLHSDSDLLETTPIIHDQ